MLRKTKNSRLTHTLMRAYDAQIYHLFRKRKGRLRVREERKLIKTRISRYLSHGHERKNKKKKLCEEK